MSVTLAQTDEQEKRTKESTVHVEEHGPSGGGRGLGHLEKDYTR